MNQDLVDEIDYMINSLAKSGFFSPDEIIEILEDQFIEEEIDFSSFEIPANNFNNKNFNKLENSFINLAGKNIVGVHNCGYDIEEGVNDVFELYVHLTNNKFDADGFCNSLTASAAKLAPVRHRAPDKIDKNPAEFRFVAFT